MLPWQSRRSLPVAGISVRQVLMNLLLEREREFRFRRIKSVGSEQRYIPKLARSGVRPHSEI